MRKSFITSIFSLGFFTALCQNPEVGSELNLDFEIQENGSPKDWTNFGSSGYVIEVDSLILMQGAYSRSIRYKDGILDYKAWSYTLPVNYEGKKITLTGYIKTENVSDGFAGLWMRIDPGIAFDNMEDRGVEGTTDWTKYEISLDMNPSKTTQIVFGGLMAGKGKMWFDDLRITIDGKDISKASPYVRVPFPAELDTAFDKGSGIVFPELNTKLISDLELLGRIWGFLKYHHPAIVTGTYNWDYELFRMLPGYLKAANTAERDDLLLSWLAKYGEIPHCKKCSPVSDDAFIKPDLIWIEDSDMHAVLKLSLQHVYQNRHQGDHYYIGLAPFVKNPEFKNENPYADMSFPDAGFRLLAVYRYWNMIRYFFPYTHLIEKNWNTVLKEYIPLFIEAKDELEYEIVAIRIIGDIQDTHANLWGGGDKLRERKGKNFAPFRVEFVEHKLVVTDYYNPEKKVVAGPDIGDVITHIDGLAIDELVHDIRYLYPASNQAARLRDIASDLFRSNSDEIEIRFVSLNGERTVVQPLYVRDSLNIYGWYKVEDEKCYKLLEGNIGYVTLESIKQEDVQVIMDSFKNTKGLIIDIRNYPSAFMPFALGGWFVSEATPFVKFTIGNPNHPGEFTFGENLSIPAFPEPYQGKVVVLVNELSQSQAEYTAMAFRAGANTTIIGSTTAGADGNVSGIELPGGLRSWISGIGVYYPDGTETQQIGIVPDIELRPTIEGIRQGRDEVLERAIGIAGGKE